ncbi:MAG TPA: sensor histidine kinase [Terrisporobacter glycolicus]|uniref:sensor histidine kinase n=1 Tax=Terrisporobacter TaxID=1505652 RepID=UPI000E8CA821|nr:MULTISPECIES: sensor histidine kinase [Terrisporobacter]MBN9648054.1 sensor histidine kinase [Terrisporobacter glycolicus]HBI94280.1 sensor histidine kinase [Terrisporobacter hibernicus]
MKMIDYIKDKVLFLSVNLMFFILISLFMGFAKAAPVIIFLLFCIWFLPLITYMLLEYIKYRKYFNNIETILENLDKKYLLPEVIDDANFMVGEKVNDILKELSRDMHENVNYYKNIQEEYREYIEMWVHEIKTPIASSKLLIENNNNEITRKINIQMDRIENFVEQVLYYSRSDEVGKDYIIKKIELSQVIKNVIKKNQRDFISKRISLQLDDINEIIYSDTKWVEFILNQIVGNAIKYSKGTQDKITIKAKKLGSSVVLTVEDKGVGIVEQDINRVFEKGFTGENGRKFGKSTGIGLYLCKKLCVKLGLGLQIDSNINEGTKVSIIFPKTENLVEK